MAEVFLAKAAGPGGFEKTLVVKRILPQLAARESFVEMFLAEARIAAQLSHQNIVQIFDFGEEDGSYFIAMEHVEGLNLRSLVRWLKESGPLSPVLAAQIVMQACEGLAYAHDFVNPATGQPLGLVHRDVSAENIMITRTGGVKVLDFGIARVAGEENGTRNGLLKGKIAYMAVEQLRAEELDRRADVYALGVVLYQLLTCHRPYERPTEVALITAILNEPPTPVTAWRPDLPPPLVAIIELAMARDRDDRFSDCRALRDALEHWVTSTGAVGSSAALAAMTGRALEAEAARLAKSSGLSVVFASSSDQPSESASSAAPKRTPSGRSSVQPIEFDADDKTNPDELLSPVPLGAEPDYFDRPRAQHAIPLQTQKAYPNPLAEEFDARDEPPTTPHGRALHATPTPPPASVGLPMRTLTPTPVPAPTALPQAITREVPAARFLSAAAALASAMAPEPPAAAAAIAATQALPGAPAASASASQLAVTRDLAPTPAPSTLAPAAQATASTSASQLPATRGEGASQSLLPSAPVPASASAVGAPRGDVASGSMAASAASSSTSPGALRGEFPKTSASSQPLAAPSAPTSASPLGAVRGGGAAVASSQSLASPSASMSTSPRGEGATTASSPSLAAPSASTSASPLGAARGDGATTASSPSLAAPSAATLASPLGAPRGDGAAVASSPSLAAPSASTSASRLGEVAAAASRESLEAPTGSTSASPLGAPRGDGATAASSPSLGAPSASTSASRLGDVAAAASRESQEAPTSSTSASPRGNGATAASSPSLAAPSASTLVSPPGDVAAAASSASLTPASIPTSPLGAPRGDSAGVASSQSLSPSARPTSRDALTASASPSLTSNAPQASPLSAPPGDVPTTSEPTARSDSRPTTSEAAPRPGIPLSTTVQYRLGAVDTSSAGASAPPAATPPSSADPGPASGVDAPGPRRSMPTTAAPALAPAPAPRISNTAPAKAPSSSPSGLARNLLAPAGFPNARLLAHTRKVVAPMAILGALRDGVATQRGQGVLRKLPPIAARLMELSPEFAARLDEVAGALVDAALLADEHGVLAKVLEHFDARGGRFALVLRAELTHPLRLVWLTERLRAGPPLHTASLHAWLTRLGAAVVPLLLQAIDELEPGPGQDFLCRVLAGALGTDLSPVVERLETATGKRLATLSCVLEATGSVDRVRVFQKLIARRDPALTRQVMSGRAKLRSPEAVAMLEAGLGDRDESIRLHAMRLLCEVGDARTRAVLLTQVQHPLFDKRTDVERAGWWAALLEANEASAFAAAEEQLAQKTTLLGRKKAVAVKLAIVTGLGEASRHEAARALLERTAANKAQPDEVIAAAKAALTPPPVAMGTERLSLEQRAQLRRALVLDLAMTARAMTVVDLRGGSLDPTLERLRAALRALVLQDGKLEFSVRPDGVVINGSVVPLLAQAQDHGPVVARTFHGRDLQAFGLDGPVPVGELRAFLLQQLDPAGATSRVAHVRVKTFSGRPPVIAPPVAPTSTGRSVEAWRAAVDYLLSQRDAARVGKPMAIDAADGFLDQWSRLYAEGAGQLLCVWPTEPGAELRFAVHAANAASVAMAFASDLELGLATVREVAELSLAWALAELSLPDEKRTKPGEIPSEEVRLRLAALVLSQVRSRRGPAAAVAGNDLGLDARDPRRGPGVVPSIVALAETWDVLVVMGELDPLVALEQVNTRYRERFMPEVLDLFVRWAQGQLGR